MAFLLSALPLSAIELFTSTAELIRSAPYVSQVVVEEGALTGGVLEYHLLVIADFKKSLPERIVVRLPILPEMGVDRRPEPAGSQWIVMLGEPRDGRYPLRSINWGRIPLYLDDSGELRLARSVTGLGGGAISGRSMTLREFQDAVRRGGRP